MPDQARVISVSLVYPVGGTLGSPFWGHPRGSGVLGEPASYSSLEGYWVT
jgi:hypothetical protein